MTKKITFYANVRSDYAIRIPKNFWEVLGIGPKDMVEVTIRKTEARLVTRQTEE